MIDRLRSTARVALAGAALLFLGSCSDRKPEIGTLSSETSARQFRVTPEQRGRVGVAQVGEVEFRPTVETTGTVAFDQNASTQVIAPISGPVARILAPLGQRVAAGEPLAEVASPDFAAAVATYRKAVAGAANLRRIADLDQKLFEAGGIPRRDLEQAQTDALAAESDRDAALAQLRSIGIPPDSIERIRQGQPAGEVRSVVRAPIAGTVVERLISPGQLLQAGTTPCFTVADLTTMWVMANVFEKDLASVRAGEEADIQPPDSAPVTGRVDYVGDLVNPDTRAVPVRIVASNRAGLLKKDAYVRVAIHAARASRGILVPVSSVLRDDENLPFVFLESADGSFARRAVRLGGRAGDRYEIADGLRTGDRIVTEGGLFLQFAQNQ